MPVPQTPHNARQESQLGCRGLARRARRPPHASGAHALPLVAQAAEVERVVVVLGLAPRLEVPAAARDEGLLGQALVHLHARLRLLVEEPQRALLVIFAEARVPPLVLEAAHARPRRNGAQRGGVHDAETCARHVRLSRLADPLHARDALVPPEGRQRRLQVYHVEVGPHHRQAKRQAQPQQRGLEPDQVCVPRLSGAPQPALANLPTFPYAAAVPRSWGTGPLDAKHRRLLRRAQRLTHGIGWLVDADHHERK